MADWEEIKRLAADFQRAQLSSTVQRLSERNCVEIVQRLQHLQLIDVIYTTDGKEYLTPQELGKEIREELLVHGGRVNLVELQQIINVDFSHIEAKVSEIVKGDKNLTLVLGQIIDVSYLDNIAEEINDQLQEQGQVTVGDMTKAYDLPGDFISEAIQDRLGTIIQGQRDDYDRNIIFTEAFVARNSARVRGAFSAVTKPVSIMSMINQFGLQERLAYVFLEELISSGHLAGTLSGGRQDKGQYTPDIYTQAQNQWVDDFYKQNGYLEYDALVRLGINDPKAFIKKRFKEEPVLYLSTCCVGRAIQDRIQAEVDEALGSVSWVDVMPSLPSIVSPGDVNQLLTKCLKSKTGACLFCDSIVASQVFVDSLRTPFENIMESRAQKDAVSNPAFLSLDKSAKAASIDEGGREDRKEQRRKKAAGGGKQGGGTQGRESKTKSTKKKGPRGRADQGDDSDDDGGTSTARGRHDIPFLSLEEIEADLQNREGLKDCPEFTAALAAQLHRPLTRQYQEVLKSVFLQTMGTATGSARKKTHSELTEKITGLWLNAKLFEKGMKFFPEETQSHLCKHLLRTVCTDITNLAFSGVATEHMISLTEDTNADITATTRLKLLGQLPEDKTKNVLSKLHASLNGKDLDDFLHQLEVLCGTGQLEIQLKKPDKKKEKQLVFNHRQALAEQLRSEADPAMALHLAAVLLFMVYTQCMVHAPGRCVPQLLSFLKDYVKQEAHQDLICLQDLIVLQLKNQSEPSSAEVSAEDADGDHSKMQDLVAKVKDIALSARRSGGGSTAANVNDE